MENTLNIQITLNDEQLKSLIMGNITDLPKEKIQDVILQAIKEFLTSAEGQKMFIEKTSYSYNDRPSAFLQKLVDQADISKTISPVVNKAVEDFSTHYPEILERCLKSSITELFMDQFSRSRLEDTWTHVCNLEERFR